MAGGAEKIGVPYLPDRIAQLTRDHEGHPACHFCSSCTTGCDTGSFFSTPWRFLPRAEATNNLELRTNALARNILVHKNGMANGVAYVDRTTKQAERHCKLERAAGTRWQNVKNPKEEKFIRGYSVYPGGGCGEFPWYASQAEGFGSSYKREIKRRSRRR